MRERIRRAIKESRPSELIARVVLTRWHTGFMRKSGGLPDEFGNEWSDILPETKRRKRAFHTQNARNRRRRWDTRHREIVAQLVVAGMGLEDARAKATELAWGPSRAPINIDTERLEKSLRPHHANSDQVRDVAKDLVRVGTEVPYAKYVNRKRRVKPTRDEVMAWLTDVADSIRTVIIQEVAQ